MPVYRITLAVFLLAGCGEATEAPPEPTGVPARTSHGIKAGDEAIVYDAVIDKVEVGLGVNVRGQLPVGTRVTVVDPAYNFNRAEPWPKDQPEVSRVNIKDGEHAGKVGYIIRMYLRPTK